MFLSLTAPTAITLTYEAGFVMVAQLGSSLVSEAAFDAALASRDPATAEKAFDSFYVF
jgi:hypothetical protein